MNSYGSVDYSIALELSDSVLLYVVWTQHAGTVQELRGVDNYIVKDGKIKVRAVFDA